MGIDILLKDCKIDIYNINLYCGENTYYAGGAGGHIELRDEVHKLAKC